MIEDFLALMSLTATSSPLFPFSDPEINIDLKSSLICERVSFCGFEFFNWS
jgi:hypothetical protein